ncbi:MAG: transporter [Allosphingosinicella sp.]
MVPDKTTIASLRVHRLHSNLAVDPGTPAGSAHDTNLAVFQFVQALDLGGRQSFVFLVVPASRITAGGGADSESVGGLGDVQLGFVYGLHGTPALPAQDYGRHRPGLAVNAMAKLFFPTGAYSSKRSINVGANRWALRLGAPMVYAIGKGMADPGLVTVELMPTVTFFGANDDPFEADRTRQKPLFILEGHLTRGLAPRLWASLDLLWREGGALEVDGVDAHNSQSGLSLGGTATFALGSAASLRVSGGGVAARNEHGPNGWMLRTIFGVAF